MMSKRRNQKYIDREVQSSLLRRLSFHWALFLIANFMAISLWTFTFEAPEGNGTEMLRHVSLRMFPFLLVSLALAPAFIWDAIKLSNRFAGPIVRVRRTLAMIAEGKTPKALKFRSGDFWKSLAHDLNRAFLYKPSSDTSSSRAE